MRPGREPGAERVEPGAVDDADRAARAPCRRARRGPRARAGPGRGRGRPWRGRRRDSASASAASARKRSSRRRLRSRLSEPTTSATSTFAASTCGSARPSPAARAMPPRRGSTRVDDAGRRVRRHPVADGGQVGRGRRRAWRSRPDGAPASAPSARRRGRAARGARRRRGRGSGRVARAPRRRRRGRGSSRGRRGRRPDEAMTMEVSVRAGSMTRPALGEGGAMRTQRPVTERLLSGRPAERAGSAAVIWRRRRSTATKGTGARAAAARHGSARGRLARRVRVPAAVVADGALHGVLLGGVAPRGRSRTSSAPRCPRPAVPCSSKASESAAISGRPSPSAGASPRRSPRGRMPVPWSRTRIVRPVSSADISTSRTPSSVVVGVDDDVRARLGDRHLHVGDDGGVEGERVGHPGERLPHDRHALGACGERQPDVGRRCSSAGAVPASARSRSRRRAR